MARPKRDANGGGKGIHKESSDSRKNKIIKTASSERPDRRAISEMNKPRSLRSSVSSDSLPVKAKTGTPKRKKGIAYSKKTPRKRQARSKGYSSESENDADAAIKETPQVKVSTKSNALRNSEPDHQDDQVEDNDGPQYWLMKAEPDSRIEKGKDVKFSIDDLQAATEPEAWDGVRNYVARNNMRAMIKGDHAFFYHSNCKVPGIAGTMEIVQEHSVDESAFDSSNPYFDEKSSRDNPKWCVVHVAFRQKFPNFIKLKELQSFAKEGGVLQNMQVLKTTRLSVSKVTKKEWDFIMSLVEPEEHRESHQHEQNDTKSAGAESKADS